MTSDEELIRRTYDRIFSDPNVRKDCSLSEHMARWMFRSLDYFPFEEAFRGLPITALGEPGTDIGHFLGTPFNDGDKLDLGMTEFRCVEPFNYHDQEELRKRYGMDNIYSFNTDALSYLKGLEDGSTNVFAINLDSTILPNPEYNHRVMEEVSRVVPVGGVFFCTNTRPLARYASELGFKLDDVSDPQGSNGLSGINVYVRVA